MTRRPEKLLSSSKLVLDSRDQQGNVWLSQNAAKLTAFAILFIAKTSGKTRLVQYVVIPKDLFKNQYSLEVMLSNFKNPVPQNFHLLALQPYDLL